MRNKVGTSEFSTGSIKLEKAKFYTQAFVFLYLFVYTSAEAQLGCSVTRARFGDRFVFFNYSGTCNKGINPCKQIKGVWRSSARNCSCQCARSNSTYREDLGSCVENAASREECKLFFIREQDSQPLRLFNNSSSITLTTLPREDCFVTGTDYLVADSSVTWQQFTGDKVPFSIDHEDRKRPKHAHSLQWNGKPVAELFGKVVKVDVQCQKTRGRGSDTLKKLCIMFKVKGSSTNLPCPGATTAAPSTTLMTTVPRTTQVVTAGRPDVTTVLTKPKTTPDPSVVDKGKKKSHDVGKNTKLPIWLIAVVAGGAVIATLCVTIIIWLCWIMKRRSHKRRKKSRLKLDNTLCNPEDDTAITFSPWCGGAEINEPGYARVGSPAGHKGYAHLKQTPQRCSSEYQKLLKPIEDHSGYLLPLAEVTTATDGPPESNIYSEALSPKPPQNKTKSKEYDYAKPEGIIVLTGSRSSLDNLDSHKDSDVEPEGGYVETREFEPDGPQSPLYAVVEGPNSPKSPGVNSEGAPSENEANDLSGDYIEVLPDTDSENKDAET